MRASRRPSSMTVVESPLDSGRRRILRATSRSSRVSQARYTSPNVPRPTCSMMRSGPQCSSRDTCFRDVAFRNVAVGVPCFVRLGVSRHRIRRGRQDDAPRAGDVGDQPQAVQQPELVGGAERLRGGRPVDRRAVGHRGRQIDQRFVSHSTRADSVEPPRFSTCIIFSSLARRMSALATAMRAAFQDGFPSASAISS